MWDIGLVGPGSLGSSVVDLEGRMEGQHLFREVKSVADAGLLMEQLKFLFAEFLTKTLGIRADHRPDRTRKLCVLFAPSHQPNFQSALWSRRHYGRFVVWLRVISNWCGEIKKLFHFGHRWRCVGAECLLLSRGVAFWPNSAVISALHSWLSLDFDLCWFSKQTKNSWADNFGPEISFSQKRGKSNSFFLLSGVTELTRMERACIRVAKCWRIFFERSIGNLADIV